MPSNDFDARATELLRSAPGPAPWLCRAWIAPPGLRWDESEGVARGMSESGKVIFWFPMYTALVGAAAGEVSVARPSRDLKVTTYRFDLQTPEIADGWGVIRGPEAKVVTNASVVSVVDLVLGTPGVNASLRRWTCRVCRM